MDLAAASLRAGFERPLRVGDFFRTLGPRPCCVEYTDAAPFGDRIGALPRGTIIEAQEVVVRQRYPSEDPPLWRNTFISIRCVSQHTGDTAWVNVSRGSTKFANLVTQAPPGRVPVKAVPMLPRRPQPY